MHSFTRHIYQPAFLSLVICVSILLVSCNNSYVDNIDRGSGYNYRPGLPELRVSATGQINENNVPTIIISGNIVYGSLVYARKDSAFKASATIDVYIRKESQNDADSTHSFSPIGKSFTKEIETRNEQIINSQQVFRFEEIFEVEPGNYIVELGVTDQVSKKRIVRTLTTELPDPNDDTSHLTEIRILGKDNSISEHQFHPATTYDIPSSTDSLKFVFQVTNSSPDQPLDIESRLLKFKSDTSIARPMHFNNYSPSSIQRRGIDYDSYEVIQSSTRRLEQTGSVVIELIFSDLSRGNYRVEVTAETADENTLYKARDFSMKSPNYPSIKTPLELARPLYYLMNEKEYKKLLSIENPAKLKKAIDRFWLSHIKNSKVAKNVISQYYHRVEEANKQFSNYKEGWKTDPGMIYILFGPPWYNDHFSDQMVWSYSYNQNNPEKNFLFVQPKLKSKFYPFYNFQLQRHSMYYSIEYEQVSRWLSGSILNTNL